MAGDEKDLYGSLPLRNSESVGLISNNAQSVPKERTLTKLAVAAGLLIGSVVVLAKSSQHLFEDRSTLKQEVGNSIDHYKTSLNYITSKRSGSEYPTLSRHILDAYGHEIVVEPDTEMELSFGPCENDESCDDLVWEISPLTTEKIIGDVSFDVNQNGKTLLATFSGGANNAFEIIIRKNEKIILKSKAISKYIRRDIYEISEADRTKYFEAMHTVFTMSDDEGKKLYGNDYVSHAHLTALHDSANYKYHFSLFFLTSHPTMQIILEKSLLSIDKTLILPYWDFLKEKKLGSKWSTSPIYNKEWFGPIDNIEDNFRIQGRFHDVMKIYDPDYKMFPIAQHDVYGFLGRTGLTSTSKYLQRSNSYCGFKSIQGPSSCSNVQSCFDNYETNLNLYDFDACLELKVHGNLHLMHSGQWDCSVNWSDFYNDIENNQWLDEEFFSILAVRACEGTRLLVVDEMVSCPDSCDLKSSSPSSTIVVNSNDCYCAYNKVDINTASDIDHLSLTDRTERTKFFWEYLMKNVYGVPDYTKEETYSFISGSVIVPLDKRSKKPITIEQLDQLNTLLLKTMYFPGKAGVMTSAAASNDPLFWVMHQMFDKAVHALRLSPKYNKNKFVWNNKDYISWTEKTPFIWHDFEPYLGGSSLNTESNSLSLNRNDDLSLNNKQLWDLLHPGSNAIPYVYDKLTTWGDCSFDPFSTDDDTSE